MASFAPVKGSRTEIENTPIIDGQVLFETDQGNDGKIYIDDNLTRVPIGGGSSALSTLGDVTLTSPIGNREILQYNGTKWVNANALDDWLRDGNGNIQEVAVRVGGSGEYTYTFTLLNSNYGYEPYITCASNQKPPILSEMIINQSAHSATIKLGEVTGAQVGSNECKLRLRELK